MKTFHSILLLFFIAHLFALKTYAQQKDEAKVLLDAGVTLHNQGKYDEAIEKYKAAAKLKPDYDDAYYEIGYSLFSSGKEKEAIPYLEKVLSLNPNAAGAYDMLGSIYDDDKQTAKAIEYYRKGLKMDPSYQRLHFNIAITLFRDGQTAEAETYAASAIKLQPKHASSHRIYAMILADQKKLGCALLAWCSFLILEPNTKRSDYAYNRIHEILTYGIKKTGDKSVNINIAEADLNSGNLMLPMTILNATLGKTGLSATDSLKLQLTQIFKAAPIFYGDKGNGTFFNNYYADYFKKLGESENMEAFARVVSLTVRQDENTKWFKENQPKLSALDSWVANTKRF
ncbi:tetratricopeptide repeat protein [Mucilaginibacter sp. cycad4]|uniref:tetratricopeptide repeat protein n=1 Tax=Mucilaginibacter sp. cycad4 TaxID=3342096 RepID=UPI002AABA97E|nr:tetratricopeptide repeat protein [Mucilaginibacter gossypii]WPU98817.1 tetratricopeptide repeat protein [Mucilaginibacter gossypii]